MPVLAASVRALVTPVTISTSMASHQASMVAQSRSVSGMFAVSTKSPRRIFCSAASARLELASSRAQLLLHTPGRADLVGRVLGAQGGLQPGQRPGAESVAGAQQQSPVGPGRV